MCGDRERRARTRRFFGACNSSAPCRLRHPRVCQQRDSLGQPRFRHRDRHGARSHRHHRSRESPPALAPTIRPPSPRPWPSMKITRISLMNVAGLLVVDVGNPAIPHVTGAYAHARFPSGVAVAGEIICIADGGGGLQLIDVSDPSNPRRVGGTTGFTAFAVATGARTILLAAGDDGLVLFQVPPPPVLLQPICLVPQAGFRLSVQGSRALKSVSSAAPVSSSGKTGPRSPSPELCQPCSMIRWHSFSHANVYRAVAP